MFLQAIVRTLKEKVRDRNQLIRKFRATAEVDDNLKQQMDEKIRQYKEFAENLRHEHALEQENELFAQAEKNEIAEEEIKRETNNSKNSTFMLSPNALLNGSQLNRIRKQNIHSSAKNLLGPIHLPSQFLVQQASSIQP